MKRLASLMVFCLSVMAFGQSISITGTVVDSATSQAIANATVRLTDMPSITAVTNASGQFTLSGSVAVSMPGRGVQGHVRTLTVKDNTLILGSMPRQDVVTIDVFGATGALIRHIQTTTQPGAGLTVADLWQAPGLYQVRVRAGGYEQTISCLGAGTNTSRSARPATQTVGALSKMQAVHTVQVIKPGYVTKRTTVNGETGATGAIALRALPGLTMKDIPAGKFSMGQTGVAEPVREVTLRAFAMQETEVTQELYIAVMGFNPAGFVGSLQLPVELVIWAEAAVFCNTLSKLCGLDTVYNIATGDADLSKNGYRLPTEAQWEYACRGGTTTMFWWGDAATGLGTAAWYYSNSGLMTHAVKTKQANGYGLYDVNGNVWEWCNDWYGDYAAGAQSDPVGPASGMNKVLRGGSWRSGHGSSDDFRCANRFSDAPDFYYNGYGLRCVLPR